MKSKSGKFEIWVEVVVEGDCCTPSKVYRHKRGEYDTSEAFEKALKEVLDSGAFCIDCRYPEAYYNRMQKLQALKMQRENILESFEEIPF